MREMIGQVLFLQGGGSGAYEADRLLAADLKACLGSEYAVAYPKMPDEDKPVYEAWAAQITAWLAEVRGEAVLAGHSLGASFLIKYMAEQQPDRPIAGMFLLAPPFWGAEDWEVDEYVVRDELFAGLARVRRLFFYHSRDDRWVPYSHLDRYAGKLPHAVLRRYDGLGHQFDNDLSEVARDIRSVCAP